MSSVSVEVDRTSFSTHVSIQLMMTRPLTMLHRSNLPSARPQSRPLVRAVSEAEPESRRQPHSYI